MAKSITVEIIGDADSLSRAFRTAGNSADRLGSSLGGKLMTGLKLLGVAAAGAAVALGVGFAAVLKHGVTALIEHEKALAQTEAVIKSTGGAANVTAKDVTELADSIEKMSGVDDLAVQAGENMLLTFKNIRNEVGAGNDIFDQATLATTNLSVALGKDMPAAALLVGKALNDPIAGLTALTRAGVQFTDGQKEAIKAMVESGNVMGAQKIILKELESQFGGSAAALGDTFAGKVAILKERFEEMAMAVAERVMPHLERFVEFLGKLGEAESFGEALRIIGEGIKELGVNLFNSVQDAVSGIDWAGVAQTAWDGLSSALSAGWKAMQKIDFSGLTQRITEGIGSALGNINWGSLISAAIKLEVDWLKFFAFLPAKIMIGIVQALAGADWGAIGTAILDGIEGAVSGVGAQLSGIWGPVQSAVADAAEFISEPFITAFDAVRDVIGDAAGFVIDRFADIVGAAGDFAGLFDWIPGVGDNLGGLADSAQGVADRMRGMAESLRGGQANATGLAGSVTGTLNPALGAAIGISSNATNSIRNLGTTAHGQMGPLTGMTGGVNTLTGAITKIPDRSVTNISTPGADESAKKADRVTQEVKGIPDTSRTRISETGSGATIGAALGVASAVNSIPTSVTVSVNYVVGSSPGPGFASGGTVPWSGMFTVGERGRELVALPAGAQVFPHGQTERMLGASSTGSHAGGGSGGGPTIVNVNVYGSVTTERDLVRAVRDGLSGLSMHTPTLWGGR